MVRQKVMRCTAGVPADHRLDQKGSWSASVWDRKTQMGHLQLGIGGSQAQNLRYLPPKSTVVLRLFSLLEANNLNSHLSLLLLGTFTPWCMATSPSLSDSLRIPSKMPVPTPFLFKEPSLVLPDAPRFCP